MSGVLSKMKRRKKYSSINLDNIRSIEYVLKNLIGQIYEEKTYDDIDFVMWMIVSLTHLSAVSFVFLI